MKIFLGTANLNEIQQTSDFGLPDGITTSPTLAAKASTTPSLLCCTSCQRS